MGPRVELPSSYPRPGGSKGRGNWSLGAPLPSGPPTLDATERLVSSRSTCPPPQGWRSSPGWRRPPPLGER
eukprot:8037891-Lingulodinium_polyedra.AAC.1